MFIIISLSTICSETLSKNNGVHELSTKKPSFLQIRFTFLKSWTARDCSHEHILITHHITFMFRKMTFIRKALETIKALHEFNTLWMLFDEMFLQRNFVSKPLVTEWTLWRDLKEETSDPIVHGWESFQTRVPSCERSFLVVEGNHSHQISPLHRSTIHQGEGSYNRHERNKFFERKKQRCYEEDIRLDIDIVNLRLYRWLWRNKTTRSQFIYPISLQFFFPEIDF